MGALIGVVMLATGLAIFAIIAVRHIRTEVLIRERNQGGGEMWH